MRRTVLVFLPGLLLLTGAGAVFAQERQAPVTPIPVLTDEDRTAAFPDVTGHREHEGGWNYYVLFDQLEWRSGNSERTGSWYALGWIGGDVNRLWFRTEGEADRRDTRDAEASLFYGRSFSRWWDFVAGVRQDVRPGPGQTWAAAGIQGLAPNFFEVEATAYVGASGRTQVRLEAEYEMLITNRLILQPRGELNLSGKSDAQRGVGSGLSSGEAGLRLRYEFRRELAPYVGIVWDRKFGGTADYARAQGDSKKRTRFIAGLRFWF